MLGHFAGRKVAMTEAEENFAYWVQSYANDLAKNRDPSEFGMRWMAHQIEEWRETVEAQRSPEAAADAD